MKDKEKLKRRPQYPRRAPIDRHIDISYGDPVEVFGIDDLFQQYRVERRVFTLTHESVIGRLYTSEAEMDLTADVVHNAVRLLQYDDANNPTGKILYVIYREMLPHSIISWDFAPIEQIQPNWPEGVEFPKGSLAAEITRRDAKTLAVSVEQIWRERGGDPSHHIDKPSSSFKLERDTT
jgi:hypothetical protein